MISTDYAKPLESNRRIKSKKFVRYVSENPASKLSRNNSKCFTNTEARSVQYKISFIVKTIQDWNSLHNNIVCEKTLDSFRNILRKCMLEYKVRAHLLTRPVYVPCKWILGCIDTDTLMIGELNTLVCMGLPLQVVEALNWRVIN